ncbi:hypothetical protein [Marinobacterium rhizophilum]|nr:hypothetical protein [Marinobacterium rhizophilum]
MEETEVSGAELERLAVANERAPKRNKMTSRRSTLHWMSIELVK